MAFDLPHEEYRPIQDVQACADLFASHERPASRQLIGVEYETIPIEPHSVGALGFDGTVSVEGFLNQLVGEGYQPVTENGRTIAATHRGYATYLEPGCQIEYSGSPHRTIVSLADELDRNLRHWRHAATRANISILGTGFRPWGNPFDFAWSPSQRHQRMREFVLGQREPLAVTGASMCASVQVSLDYGSERDFAEKLRASLALQPIIVALTANSPIANGRRTEFKSYRVHVWPHVDRSRCGLLDFVFDSAFMRSPYQSYTEWALDRAVIGLRRGGKYIDTVGTSFRDFIEAGGTSGITATLADWDDHLSTLFPEVRVKKVIELRAIDSGEPATVKAVAALWKGLLYDGAVRERAWRIVSNLSVLERRWAMRDASRSGLAGRLADGRTFRQLALELLDLAAAGLRHCGDCDDQQFLAPLYSRAESGVGPADETIAQFEKHGMEGLIQLLRIA